MDEQLQVKETILQLEKSLLEDETRSSMDTVGNLLTEDFLEHGTSGRSFSKADIIANGLETVDLDIRDFDVRILSEDTVLATFRTCDEASGQQQLRSSIWRYQPGGWRLLFHQGTPVER
ncbi:DUF4440 domain-containing protein [Terribacillus sp. 7520-G]|uniref:nuclear transport factor 2 family protein n=1 Tax=Terribacillus TaxID=459532 RepID=UPI000BA75EDD|nr:DUF4440 domain-containing protein [Terribacillus sp. 7520-G]PAD37965.1 hypothetical protein CHH53_13640 [Terribacillus sp. 7520-G]